MWMPVLTVAQAIRYTIVAVLAGPFVGWALMAWKGAGLGAAVAAGIGVPVIGFGMSWTAIDESTLRIGTRWWNVSVGLAFVVLVSALFTSGEGEPFPTYGIVLLIILGVTAVGPDLVLGARNFALWRSGADFEPDDDID